MKRLALLLLIFAVVMVVIAADQIRTPALHGMFSNTDYDSVPPSGAYYLENATVHTKGGVLTRRNGMRSVGDNDITVYAATGFYDEKRFMKTIVGVTDSLPDSIYHLNPDDSTVEKYTLTAAPLIIAVSDSFDFGIQDTFLHHQGALLSGDDIDISHFNSYVIFADGRNIPYIYTHDYGDYAGAPVGPDSAAFLPHIVSMGLEAPGQLRVGLTMETDPNPKYGDYVYAYGFSDSELVSIPTRVITLDGKAPYLSLFEPDYGNQLDSVVAFIWRKRIPKGNEEVSNMSRWYIIDTVVYGGHDYPIYIDTLAEGYGTLKGSAPAGFFERWGPILVGDSTQMPPGALDIFPNSDIDIGPDSLYDFAVPADTHYFAYSYYDPIRDIESPLGRIMKAVVVTQGGSADTLMLAFRKQHTKEKERPKWIRVYRSEDADLTKFYGLFELRANHTSNSGSYTDTTHQIYIGYAADSQLTTGLVKYVNDTLGLSGRGYTTGSKYKRDNMLINESGDAVVLPAYVNQLQVPFSDMATANARMWGIGDPLFRSRLYWSGFNDFGDWNLLNYIEVGDEAGSLVAIETLVSPQGDIIIVFKKNSVWIVVGEDPQYDMTYGRIENDFGAIAKKSIINTGEEVLFMSPDLKIYTTNGSKPVEISGPIENWIDSLFTNYKTAVDAIVAFQFNDRAMWVDTANNRALAFDIKHRTWGIESWVSNYRPVGSFKHDTLAASFSSANERPWWTFQNDAGEAGEKFQAENVNGVYVDTLNTTEYIPSFVYESPYIGGGSQQYQIDMIDLIANWTNADSLSIYIINENMDTVSSRTIISDARKSRNYRIGMAPSTTSNSSFLKLRIESSATLPFVDIHSVRLNERVTGNVPVD